MIWEASDFLSQLCFVWTDIKICSQSLSTHQPGEGWRGESDMNRSRSAIWWKQREDKVKAGRCPRAEDSVRFAHFAHAQKILQ